ncbi:hypothetical protein JCM10213v2_004000 [Rhodosporidiobolus nylandii]
MATLERSRGPSTATTTATAVTVPDSLFDASAVPSAFRPLIRRQHAHEDDLIDLGEEQLFRGTRAREGRGMAARAVGSCEVDEALERQYELDGRQEGSQELLGSLGAARHAFLFALYGVLQQYFPSSHSASPPLSSATPDSLADPVPLLAPLGRLSGAAPAASDPQPEDLLLSTILDTLRSHSPHPRALPSADSPIMRSIERSSPSLDSSAFTYSAHSASQPLLEELQIRVDTAAQDLPPLEADLARSLASLITCIKRLSTISRTEGDGAAPHARMRADPVAANVHETLERETAALQARRDVRAREAQAVVGVAREVEQAERDLLWGRVDDLSERVKLLSRRRAETLAEDGREEQEQEQRPALAEQQDEKRDLDASSARSWTGSLYEPSLSDLPRYSHEHDSVQRQSQQQHLPPAYYHDYQPDEKKSLGEGQEWAAQPPQTPAQGFASPSSASASARLSSGAVGGLSAARVGRARKISSVHTEKMQRDLDNVTSALERLYVVAPQLANQRVEPDRRKQRERQLAKLGNAIERLSKGRLEDQRAVANPLVDEEPESHAKRRKREQEALDRLLDQVDKAASRTLADQRAELNGKRKEGLNSETANPDFEPLSDKYEARRREYILANTGKGRLAGQDATLPSSSGFIEPFPPPDPELSAPVTVSEFFADEPSTPASTKAVKKKFSSRGLFQTKAATLSPATTPHEDDAPVGSAAGKKGALRIGAFKRTASAGRRSSYDASGMSGLGVFGSVLAVPELDWIAEESRNLGTLVVTFWSRSSSSRQEEYEVLSVEADAILVAPRGGPASRLSLPCRVVPQQAVAQTAGTVSEVKLVTNEPSPTRNRADLEVHTPLSTDDLRRSMPTSFACSTCNVELADVSAIQRYNALPSEHWAELLDAWMCHQDQELSADLIAKGKGIKPRPDEGLVGTSYVLLPRELTRNWVTPDESESIRSPSDDLLFPAHCASCSSLIGSHVKSLHADSGTSADSTSFRLLKYATYPARHLSKDELEAGLVPPPRYSLASLLTAEMLETGQAHACHRFILEEAETEKAKLLLWFFNPAVRLAFSSATATVGILDLPSASPAANGHSSPSSGPSPASSSPKLFGRSMNAVKIFYAIVAGDDDPRCTDFLEAKSERIPYPRAIIDRVADMLRASTLVYPTSKRKWATLDVGFLERI